MNYISKIQQKKFYSITLFYFLLFIDRLSSSIPTTSSPPSPPKYYSRILLVGTCVKSFMLK